MSDNIEELSTEDKKKAINLQDLVYVKKYIDDNHYDKYETDTMIADLVESKVNEVSYTKEEIDNNLYNKTQAESTFYKKNEKVLSALAADYAEQALNSHQAEDATNAKKAEVVTYAITDNDGEKYMLKYDPSVNNIAMNDTNGLSRVIPTYKDLQLAVDTIDVTLNIGREILIAENVSKDYLHNRKFEIYLRDVRGSDGIYECWSVLFDMTSVGNSCSVLGTLFDVDGKIIRPSLTYSATDRTLKLDIFGFDESIATFAVKVRVY